MKQYQLQQKPNPFPDDGLISTGFITLIWAKLAVESKFSLSQSKLKADSLPQHSFYVEQITQQNLCIRA